MNVLNVALGVLLVLGNLMALRIWWWLGVSAVSRLWNWGTSIDVNEPQPEALSELAGARE